MYAFLYFDKVSSQALYDQSKASISGWDFGSDYADGLGFDFGPLIGNSWPLKGSECILFCVQMYYSVNLILT